MINVDNKIKNIYYMLCYSFNKDLLTEKSISDVSDESFDNIYNLFSMILCLMLKKQIKKGMHRDYIRESDELNTVKGKINLTETINKNSLLKKRVVCNYDEFSENNLFNKIIKTTANYLIRSSKIGKFTKNELKKCMIYFNNVDIIEIKAINWDTLRFNRNNNSYKNILLVCRLILKGLIVTNKKGENKFREFLDTTTVSAIYENFLKAYFRKHYDFNASSRILHLTEENAMYIPTMRTDITLEYKNKMLIIDAKFYDKILKEGYINGSKIITPGNIYQINAYVENQQQKIGKENVYGMLLYAQTTDEPIIDSYVQINQKLIMVKTIDLTRDWLTIKNTLDKIANDFINDNFQKKEITN